MMKNKLRLYTFIGALLFLCLSLINVSDEITSIHDKKIPEKIRQKLLEKKFTEDDNTLSGTYTTIVNEDDRPGVTYKYDYNFRMEDETLTGTIKLEKIYVGYDTKTSTYGIDIPKILECCKKPGSSEEICFKPSEKTEIKQAKQNGCNNWYKKIIP